VGRTLSKTCFLICLTSPVSGGCPLRIMWSVTMAQSNGTLCLLARFMTGRWRFWLRFIAVCIRISLDGSGRINCGGFL
jgi:hypothetical protein